MRLISAQDFRNFLYTLDALRLVTLLCLAFAVFVIFPDQSLELYRYTAQSLAESYNSGFAWKDDQGLIESIVLILSVSLLASTFLWAASVLHSLRSRLHQNGAEGSFNTTIFSLVGCIPCLAVAIGLLRAAIDTRSLGLKNAMLEGARISFEKDIQLPELIARLSEFDVNSELEVNWWLYSGAIAMVLFSAMFYFAAYRLFRGPPQSTNPFQVRDTHLIALGIGLPILLSVAFVLFPVGLPRAISAFGVVCLFFGTVTLFIVAFSLLQARARMPLLFLLIVCAAAFSLLGFNDNHGVRELSNIVPIQGATPVLQTVGEGFINWLKERRDRNRYQTYPVFVVAAEGGGIYAAFRTAAFLASLQDLCPRFSHHLFAISSVSGGSVGAAIYSGLTQKIKQGNGRLTAGHGCTKKGDNVGGLFFTEVAEAILHDDFLSPALASFLFPDFLQRFLFFPVPQFDRAIALEKSLEQSWDDNVRSYYAQFRDKWVDHENPLRDSFARSWRPDGDSPALFINTTEIDSGRGRVITPFAIDTEEFSSLPLLQFLTGGQHEGVDISMSTAAVLSARFPWLTPPGSLQISFPNRNQSTASGISPRQKVQLVDGGYLDNSGVITALAIVREMERAVRNPSQKIEIKLIVLTSAHFANPGGTFADYLAPVQALLNTRAARGLIAVEQAERIFKEAAASKGEQTDKPISSIAKAVLQGYGYPLPLGWRLAPVTRLLILGQNGTSSACTSNEDSADCLRAKMYEVLNR